MRSLRDDGDGADAKNSERKLGTDMKISVSPHFRLRFRLITVFRQFFSL